MTKDTPIPTCSRCGTALSAETAGGLCPRCLVAINFDAETEVEFSGKEAPFPEELAACFPGFELLECLGRGGMGIVYKARQKALNRIVAIKILADGRHEDPAFATRFRSEAQTLAQLSHPNIVTVHDFGEAEGLFYLIMEFIDGVNLRDVLRDGKMEPEQALAIIPPICSALEFAHEKGIVHRDIKPENLLLDREGNIKMADFGIASLAGSAEEKSGTPAYMAPEQAAGSKTDRRADIYALGVVLYEMLTGEHPGSDAVAPSTKVEVDVKIDEVVLRALESEPSRRFQTAGEFRTVVETVASADPVGANIPAGNPTGAPKRRKLHGCLIVLIVLAVLLFLTGIVSTILFVFLSRAEVTVSADPFFDYSITTTTVPDAYGRVIEAKSGSSRIDVDKDGDAYVVSNEGDTLRVERDRIFVDEIGKELSKTAKQVHIVFTDTTILIKVDGEAFGEFPRKTPSPQPKEERQKDGHRSGNG